MPILAVPDIHLAGYLGLIIGIIKLAGWSALLISMLWDDYHNPNSTRNRDKHTKKILEDLNKEWRK